MKNHELVRHLQERPDVLEQVERLAGPEGPAKANGAGATTSAQVSAEEPRPLKYSDDSLASRFSDKYAVDLRYTAAWGQWLRWNGAQGERDDTLHVFDMARDVCRQAAVECAKIKPRAAKNVASAGTVAAVERLARADRRHAAVVGQWNSDPWLLNTPGGTIDLRTGEMRPHRRDDHLTKLTGASPSNIPCPRCLATSSWPITFSGSARLCFSLDVFSLWC